MVLGGGEGRRREFGASGSGVSGELFQAGVEEVGFELTNAGGDGDLTDEVFSVGVAGWRLARKDVGISTKPSCSAVGTSRRVAVKPCLRALRRVMARPSGVLETATSPCRLGEGKDDPQRLHLASYIKMLDVV